MRAPGTQEFVGFGVPRFVGAVLRGDRHRLSAALRELIHLHDDHASSAAAPHARREGGEIDRTAEEEERDGASLAASRAAAQLLKAIEGTKQRVAT